MNQRLYALHPDFRLRIENYQAYHPGWDCEQEVWFAEQAMVIVNTLRDEAKTFFFTLANEEDKRATVPELDQRHTPESLEYVGALALQYFRNPSGVNRIPVMEGTLGEKESS